MEAINKSRRWILPIGFLFALTAGLFIFKKKQDESYVKSFIGERVFSILQGASKTEVFRLTDEYNSPVPKGAKRIGEFWAIQQGKTQGRRFTAKLTKVLLSRKAHPLRHVPGGFFEEPWVAFRVWKETEFVTIVLDLHGQYLWLYDKKSPNHALIDEARFDAIYPQLIKLAKQVFPNDKEIQNRPNEIIWIYK